MYFEIYGAGTQADNGDNIQIQFADGIWIYHVYSHEAQDEPLNYRRSWGRMTVQSCYFENFTAQGKGVLINNTSSGFDNPWDGDYRYVTFYRTRFRSTRRHPQVSCPAKVDVVNCVSEAFTSSVAALIGVTQGGAALRPHLLVRSVAATPGNGGGPWYADTRDDAGDVQGIIDGQGTHLFTGGVGIAENDPGLIFTPPYSLTAAPMTTTLRSQIINEAGWQDVPFPGD